MSNLIIIRLYPKKPTTGAAFASYLTGLSITVTDMSVTDPIGKAYVVGTATYDPTDANSQIVQHVIWTPPTPPNPPPVLAAVATAVIVPSSVAHTEYESSDLRLQIKRGSQTIVDQSVNYNVLTDGPGPAPTHAKPPTAFDALLYAGLKPPAPYLALPPADAGLGSGKAFVNVPTDGSPPNFQELYTAVTTVLSKDPAPADVDAYIRSLTPQQCRHIAYEIVWNRTLLPMPGPPNSLENLYTTDSPSPAPDQDRQKFEADQITYYTTNNTQAEVLAKYVSALAAALVCEKKTSDANRAGFELPVLPGIADSSGKTAETDVILSS